ncbi:MAG: triacylglycerol lipase [Clostridiales bacterium]|nr:triacylglycerol lipase [Clostridiales bacterium]
MKRYIAPINVVYFIVTCLLLNSYMLVKAFPYTLFIIIPLFILLNALVGTKPAGTKRLRLKLCNHGTLLLAIFVCSLIPSIIWHAVLAFITIPNAYMDLIWSLVYCIVASAVLFWNGIICVYCTSTQMGIKWRVIGALCGMIPILNLVVLTKIINVTSDEMDFEIEKEIVSNAPELSQICKTKYPLVFVHGVFFRDSNLFNYWGRIPRTLKLHGATVYYGEHQSALTVKESARELAYRIKLIVERSECEKVNIIAHSKGGLDCRYAISEFGLAPYVASITTVNTPHRGCLFAERLLDVIPESVKNKVATVYNTTLTALGDEQPDFLAAVGDLTAEACQKLNEQLTFPEGIFAQSIGSVMEHPHKGQFPLNLSYRYVKNFDGENDGLVGENSFAWGEKYVLLRSKGTRGISHCDVIDLSRENIRDFDVRAFYVELVSDLKDRGL